MPSWRPITYLRPGGEPRSDDAARRGVGRGVSVQFWPKRQARRRRGMRGGDFNKVHGERFAQLPETASLSGGARNACCLGSICCIAGRSDLIPARFEFMTQIIGVSTSSIPDKAPSLIVEMSTWKCRMPGFAVTLPEFGRGGHMGWDRTDLFPVDTHWTCLMVGINNNCWWAGCRQAS